MSSSTAGQTHASISAETSANGSTRVLLTGAAGFVGSRLARRLLDTGSTVIGVDNLNDYYAAEHKQRHLRDLKGHPRFEFVRTELTDADFVRRLFRDAQPTHVAHLAAMAAVRYSVQHPLIYGQANVQASMNVLDAARLCGTNPNCVISSTGSVYGRNTPVPFREDAAADRPLAPYPASKRAMELFAHCYHHTYGLDTTVVRFFNVYGPHGRPDMMPWQWTLSILKDQPLTLFNGGKLKRDWTYIDDIVEGFIAALHKRLGYEILNLGCGNPVENLHFVHVLEGLLEKKAKIVDTPCPSSEPLETYADISKARTLLGYEPKTRVEKGLAHFIRWMKAEQII